ncbi:MAG: hypothetical protein LBS00_05005 [Synergistaceae bacterium]|nr:hypothetical protein [Synergistaceae bacterium]
MKKMFSLSSHKKYFLFLVVMSAAVIAVVFPIPSALAGKSEGSGPTGVILATGFEPFGKDKVNPSHEVVKKLPDEIEGWKVVKLEVPVTWDHTKGTSSVKTITDAIEQYRPNVVLMSGQHGFFTGLAIEKQGTNRQSKMKDNSGVAGRGGKDTALLKLDPGAQAVYRTTTPNEKMVTAAQNAGVSAFLNNNPGDYICNHVIYRVGYYLSKRNQGSGKPILYGFIHTPFLPTQPGGVQPNAKKMSLDKMVKGYEAAIEAIISEAETTRR